MSNIALGKAKCYGTALVQHCKYAHATRMVAAYGPLVYSRDTHFASNLQVVSS